MSNGNLDLSTIRLVSWDVDGTLFSYWRLGFELMKSSFRNVHTRSWIKNFHEILDFHRSVEAQRRNSDCGVIQTELQRFAQAQAREKQALEKALRKIAPRRHVVALIESFAASATIQVALSDFECDYKLDALDLSRYFAKTYSCEQIGFWKPSPIPLAQIQSDFGIRPEQHLHIGDRQATDGEACSRNGCQFLPIHSTALLTAVPTAAGQISTSNLTQS